MAIVTGALEAMLTNYDKRIRPGYGGKPKNTLERAVDGVPWRIPTLKFLTPSIPKVPPLEHDPGNRIKFLSICFLSFICENTHGFV